MSSSPDSEPFWRWRAEPLDDEGGAREVNVTSIMSPYGFQGAKPAMCYPGTPLAPEVEALATTLMGRQLNAIGTHTHGEMRNGTWQSPNGEGGFGQLAMAERGAIWMIASQLGGRFDTVDGHFCGGGTEANASGIWMGREWLQNHPDPFRRGIAVLATPITHYSIAKAVDLTGIGRSQTMPCHTCHKPHLQLGDPSGSGMTVVGINEYGQMDLRALETAFHRKYEEGFRRFIVTPTIGTTVLGSVDPIVEIDSLLRRLERTTSARFYVHVDASFGGFTAPFLRPDLPFGFQNPSVMSIAVDADKMGHLPYPAGVFLCRKGLQHLIGREVAYIRGHHDDTLPGSRSAIAPLVAYEHYRKIGVAGHRAYVERCMDARNELKRMLMSIRDERLVIGPVPPLTNFLPIQVHIENGEIPARLREGPDAPLGAYELRSDYVPGEAGDPNSCPDTVYKLCIMPHHTLNALETFYEDLRQVLRET